MQSRDGAEGLSSRIEPCAAATRAANFCCRRCPCRLYSRPPAPKHGSDGMCLKPLLRPILDNESLTRGLGDAEARALIEWLVQRAEERFAEAGADAVPAEVARLCLRAR